MNDQEDALLKALETVDAKGDVAPPNDHSPSTAVLRDNLARRSLIAWDDELGRFVVTGTGRDRIARRRRGPGKVIAFRRSVPVPKKADGTNG